VYHIVTVRHPAPIRLGSGTRTTIFGMPADSFVRVAIPLVAGALSATALVYSIRQEHHTATAVALSSVIMSSLIAAIQTFEIERGE